MMKLIGTGILAFLLFCLQRWVYQKLWNRSLYVSLEFIPKEIMEGEQGELLEIIENRKKLPLSVLKVKFQTSRYLQFTDMEGSKVTDQYYRNEIFQIGGGERITRKLTFTGIRRGYYGINGVDLVASDLFMTSQMVETRFVDSYLYIYPKPLESREFRLSLQQLNAEQLSKRHLLEDPFEFRGIREYQPYDTMRSINWKATAKNGELKVNQKNNTQMRSVRIFYNIEDNGILRKEEAVEGTFQVVAGLAQFFLTQGICVSCYGNGKDQIDENPTNIPPSAGISQQERIYKTLARVDTSREPLKFTELFSHRLLREGQGSMTILVAPNAYTDFVKLVETYDQSGEDYLWFYPQWDKVELSLSQNLKAHVNIVALH